MNKDILCTLLAQRINPEHFQLWGLEVHWMKEAYDTLKNRAIVADVISNYDVLAVQYEIEQKPIRERSAYKAEADPIYIEWQALLAIEHPEAEIRRLEWLAKRQEIKGLLDKEYCYEKLL